ncbi:MAG: UvrD-helicase domain-containing protein [Acidimicrobiaceae bacterium]|nr:UvrD-helicase domain-containing protein [Acidimicrobiaceae bacterium]
MSLESLLSDLNPAQRAAVTHASGPIVVVAGAGSGKTRVLTRRIAYLTEVMGISPYEILAITFTNKAAAEMRSRVGELIGPIAEKMWVSTFHSACVRILRQHAPALGFKSSFTIYDQADSNRLIGYVARDLDLDSKRFPARSLANYISQAKADLIAPQQYAETARNIFERKIAEVFAEYQRRLLVSSAMDFDDLLNLTVTLFENFPDVLEHYQRRFQHLLVDEYQDTNKVQNRLVALLGEQSRNVFVVGDSDQSVYGFRGADMSNILEFERSFPDAETVVLEQNYRSTQRILDAANAVIANNVSRVKKSLWTSSGHGDLIRLYKAQSDREEATFLASQIIELTSSSYSFSDIAVFYRTNSQSRVIEEEFVRRVIPYRVIGGTRFYDRKEVKDILAYLRVVHNRQDEVSLRRIINVPKRGVGEASIAKVDLYAGMADSDFVDAILRAEDSGVSGKALVGIRELLELLEKAREMAAEGVEVKKLIEFVLDRSGYMAELKAERSIDALGRVENLEELIRLGEEHETLEELLADVALVSATDADVPESTLVLMTLHMAKGLEFPVVFLTGMEDGIFPHSRSMVEPHELEEERRLFYVGITRAKEKLFLTLATSRGQWGEGLANPPSRFLDEIPAGLVEDISPRRSVSTLSYFTSRSTGKPDSGSSGGFGSKISSSFGGKSVAGNIANLRVGDDIVHAKWGEGVVTGTRGSGDNTEITVRFPTVGEKTLLLSLAPIKRA